MVFDVAGGHTGHALRVPANLRLLPRYAPEPNPVEQVCDELREKHFHNRDFDSLNALDDHIAASLRVLELDADQVQSIVAWPWLMIAQLN